MFIQKQKRAVSENRRALFSLEYLLLHYDMKIDILKLKALLKFMFSVSAVRNEVTIQNDFSKDIFLVYERRRYSRDLLNIASSNIS